MTRVTESNDLHIDFLQELLSAGHELEPTLRDDNLPSEAEELKSKYLSKYKTAVVAAQGSFYLRRSSSQVYKCPMFDSPVNEWTFWLAVQTLVSQ